MIFFWHIEWHELSPIIQKNFNQLKAKNIPEDISGLFPSPIWNSIKKEIQKDIEDLFFVYKNQKWTLSMISSYRLVEIVLRDHIAHWYDVPAINNIHEGIDFLKTQNYSHYAVGLLDIFRDDRNQYMHGLKRSSPLDSQKVLYHLMSFILQMYNLSHLQPLAHEEGNFPFPK